METRELEVSVISDLHLATHGSKPKKILRYLKSIQPRLLVLNGDIIDSWRFSRNYFPKAHLKVVRQLIKMMEKGVQVIYISGNHDEFLRKIIPTQIGNLKFANQYIFEQGGTRTWIFHGDIFDKIIHKTKWLAKLGAAAYGFIAVLNNGTNHLLNLLGKKEVQFYKSLKKKWEKNQKNLTGFEKKLAQVACQKGYQNVICGHTHIPLEKNIVIGGKELLYINCGDWVENLTAAEFYQGKWHLYYYNETDEGTLPEEPEFPKKRQIYLSLIKELGD